MSWFKGKRIVVPFDFSDECMHAVRMALQLAPTPDVIHVAHVLLELPATDPAAVWDEVGDEKRKQHLRERMDQMLDEADIQGVQVNVSIGNPGRVLTDLAREVEAGLIIIPSHGYTGLKRWFLGSVAERVVQLATCPVLVLKEDRKS